MYQAIELYVDVQKPTYVWGFIYVLYVYTREKGKFTKKRKGNDDMREVPNDVAESIF